MTKKSDFMVTISSEAKFSWKWLERSRDNDRSKIKHSMAKRLIILTRMIFTINNRS